MHDEVDTVDVDATRRDVGGHEYRGAARLEALEHAGALVLGFAAVQGLGRDTLLTQALGDALGAQLGAREHDRAAALAGGDLGQHRVLVAAVDEQHVVVHRGDRGAAVLRRMQFVLGQELPHQRLDVVVERRREQQALAVVRRVGEQRADLGQEAHVGHLIGLVERGHLDLAEDARVLPQVVAEAAGGGNEDVDAAAQLVDLLGERGAADGGAHVESERTGVRGERIDDLECEFAGRHENQRARTLGRRAVLVASQACQHGQTERERLTRTGLRATEDVLAGDGIRDGHRLDRGRHRDRVAGQRGDDGFGQADLGERHLGGGAFGLDGFRRLVDLGGYGFDGGRDDDVVLALLYRRILGSSGHAELPLRT